MENSKNKKLIVILGIAALVLIAVVAAVVMKNKKETNEIPEDNSISTTEDSAVSTEDIVVEDKTDLSEQKSEESTEDETAGNENGTDDSEPDNNKGEIKKTKGIFDGFIDSHSVEIQLDNGEYKSYLVYDEDLIEELSKLDDFERISFTYQKSTEKGRLDQIISLY